LHPEVKEYIGLSTLLYTETTSSIFKYSIFNNIVKKLNQRCLSVGKDFNKIGTSETICNESKKDKENIKSISNHPHKHQKPLNNIEFGHYLAGLIDGHGQFSSKQQLVIAFNNLDISLAYYLKKRIGYGIINKVENKNTVVFIVTAKLGIEKILYLINGKIRDKNKQKQINKNILDHQAYFKLANCLDFQINMNNHLDNHWLTGFTDANGSFQIKLIHDRNPLKQEVRLNFQLDQKNNDLLELIKTKFGGNIGYSKQTDTYYYGSTNFESARNIINYFDCYHLLSSKYLNYIKWRKAYISISNKNHLTEAGILKIMKLKNSMNSFNKDSFLL